MTIARLRRLLCRLVAMIVPVDTRGRPLFEVH
jgi:hypothetical protein